MKLVVDSDVIGAAVMGEAGRAGEAERLLAGSSALMAPAHWKAEFANVLWKSIRGGFVAADLLDEFISVADRLPIRSVDLSRLWRGAASRAVATDHPVYDVLLVELAAQEQTVVASFDQALQHRFPDLVASPGTLLRRLQA